MSIFPLKWITKKKKHHFLKTQDLWFLLLACRVPVDEPGDTHSPKTTSDTPEITQCISKLSTSPTTKIITNYFYAPGSNDRGHIVWSCLFACLFFCLFVCLSVVNFNLPYIFWTKRDKDFIFGMHTLLMTPFQMTSRHQGQWPFDLDFDLEAKNSFLYARLQTGRIMVWWCPSVRPSVTVFRTFLLHALTYWSEILCVTSFLCT